MHTYLATCGQTLAGKHQEHKEDVNLDGTPGGPRQAPMVVNDFSAGQPHCDKSNRWRQRILAIEERMLTKRFPLRFATTGLGIMLVNSWSAYDYFIQHGKGPLIFREFMKALAAEGVRVDLDRNNPQFGPGHTASHTPASGSHDLVPLRTIVGWTGSKCPRCAHCKFQCTTVCLQCSSASAIVVCHLPETNFRGVASRHQCLALHKRDPMGSTRSVASASKARAAKRKHSAKKRRAGQVDGDSDVEGVDDEDEFDGDGDDGFNDME